MPLFERSSKLGHECLLPFPYIFHASLEVACLIAQILRLYHLFRRTCARFLDSADRICGIGAKQIFRGEVGIRLCLLELVDNLPDATEAMLQRLRQFCAVSTASRSAIMLD